MFTLSTPAHFWGWVLLLVSVVWGIEFSLVHASVEQIGPNTFNMLRFAVAATTLYLYFAATGFRLFRHIDAATLHHGLILGTLLFIGFSTQTVGLQYTTASNAGFITGLNVVLVPVIAWAWLRQPQHWYVWLGVALATLGTLFLTGGAHGFGIGELWVSGCSITFAMHIVYTGVYTREVNSLALAQIQLVTVTLLSLVAALLFEQASLLDIPDILVNGAGGESALVLWWAILLGGTVGTALAVVAQTVGQQTLAAWRVALIYATEPMFAVVGAYFLLDERLSALAWLGAACIIAGMLIAELVDEEP